METPKIETSALFEKSPFYIWPRKTVGQQVKHEKRPELGRFSCFTLSEGRKVTSLLR